MMSFKSPTTTYSVLVPSPFPTHAVGSMMQPGATYQPVTYQAGPTTEMEIAAYNQAVNQQNQQAANAVAANSAVNTTAVSQMAAHQQQQQQHQQQYHMQQQMQMQQLHQRQQMQQLMSEGSVNPNGSLKTPLLSPQLPTPVMMTPQLQSYPQLQTASYSYAPTATPMYLSTQQTMQMQMPMTMQSGTTFYTTPQQITTVTNPTIDPATAATAALAGGLKRKFSTPLTTVTERPTARVKVEITSPTPQSPAHSGAPTAGSHAQLRRYKHKEVEVRRRRKISNLFSDLAALLECGPTDKASVLAIAARFVKHAKERGIQPSQVEGNPHDSDNEQESSPQQTYSYLPSVNVQQLQYPSPITIVTSLPPQPLMMSTPITIPVLTSPTTTSAATSDSASVVVPTEQESTPTAVLANAATTLSPETTVVVA